MSYRDGGKKSRFIYTRYAYRSKQFMLYSDGFRKFMMCKSAKSGLELPQVKTSNATLPSSGQV